MVSALNSFSTVIISQLDHRLSLNDLALFVCYVCVIDHIKKNLEARGTS